MAKRDKRNRRAALQQKRADHATTDFLRGMEILSEALPDPEPFEPRKPIVQTDDDLRWPEYRPIAPQED